MRERERERESLKNRVSKISMAHFSLFGGRKPFLLLLLVFAQNHDSSFPFAEEREDSFLSFSFLLCNKRNRPLLSTHRERRSAAMMSSRKRKHLDDDDDDIDALLLSNAFKRKNKKREKRLKRLDPSLMGQRGVIASSSL